MLAGVLRVEKPGVILGRTQNPQHLDALINHAVKNEIVVETWHRPHMDTGQAGVVEGTRGARLGHLCSTSQGTFNGVNKLQRGPRTVTGTIVRVLINILLGQPFTKEAIAHWGLPTW
jgi:hypothetical protein